MHLVYDIAHNIAKRESHTVEGKRHDLYVHRKGATRAFGPGHPEITERYRPFGQPVLIPGDMGSASYVLAGTEQAMKETSWFLLSRRGTADVAHAINQRTSCRQCFRPDGAQREYTFGRRVGDA